MAQIPRGPYRIVTQISGLQKKECEGEISIVPKVRVSLPSDVVEPMKVTLNIGSLPNREKTIRWNIKRSKIVKDKILLLTENKQEIVAKQINDSVYRFSLPIDLKSSKCDVFEAVVLTPAELDAYNAEISAYNIGRKNDIWAQFGFSRNQKENPQIRPNDFKITMCCPDTIGSDDQILVSYKLEGGVRDFQVRSIDSITVAGVDSIRGPFKEISTSHGHAKGVYYNSKSITYSYIMQCDDRHNEVFVGPMTYEILIGDSIITQLSAPQKTIRKL